MPVARTVRSAVLAAAPQDLWVIVGDPHHLARWWPGVLRVESVRPDGFTQVIPTKRGKPVRLDHLIIEFEEPTAITWSQEVAGTPFERLLTAWTTAVTIEPDPAGSKVTIVEDQQLRGSFRLGRVMQSRPARKRVARALENLAELV